MRQDIIPVIDSTYRITLNDLDKFAYIAGFSPGLPMDAVNGVYEDPNGVHKKVKVLFLGASGIEGGAVQTSGICTRPLPKLASRVFTMSHWAPRTGG
jgi:hypothetical protein